MSSFNITLADGGLYPAFGDQRFGWVSSPNVRGTLDIIWNCVSTLFLCLWSMLHLNIPAKHDTFWTKFFRKLRWLILGVLAPELPMLFAQGQWSSAKRSVGEMQALGFSEWTLQHAFYADGGGFVLQPAQSDPFPVSAKQVRYLVQHGYVEIPSLTREEICDKSKADQFLKALTFFQTGWFIAQTICRAIQHLTVTPTELSTIAMACTSLTTLGFWLQKPLDVETPTVLCTTKNTHEILRLAGEAAKEQWQDTPLDFVEPNAYMSSKWSKSLLRWIVRAGLQTRPMSRIPNDRDPQASNLYEHLLLAIATATFASVHFLGWNYEFATSWEQWFWRGSCLAIWALLAVYGSTEVYICYREGYVNLGLETAGAYKMKWPVCLWFFVPAMLYSFARICLLIEALICLRSLPAAAFEDVQWSAFFPHF